jgi:hypothetical protein
MSDDVWDKSEVVVARVFDDGEYESFRMDERRRTPASARYVDTVSSSLKTAVIHAKSILRGTGGVAYLATLPEFRRNDQDDTFGAEEGAYEVEFPFRTYVVLDEDCSGKAC